MTFHTFDDEYLRRLKEGDSSTEEHFANYFGELLILKLRSRLRSRQLIEDVRQETLMRVLDILQRKGGVEHAERFGAFVNAVCNNVILEMCRSERRADPMDDHMTEPADPHVDLDEPLVTWEQKNRIQTVLNNLPRKDRELLRAVYLEEADKDEICRRLRVDGDYLRVLIHRAKSRFRKVYQQQFGNGAVSQLTM